MHDAVADLRQIVDPVNHIHEMRFQVKILAQRPHLKGMLQQNPPGSQLRAERRIAGVQEHALDKQDRRDQHRLLRGQYRRREGLSRFIDLLPPDLDLHIGMSGGPHGLHAGAKVLQHIRINEVIRIHEADVLAPCREDPGIACRGQPRFSWLMTRMRGSPFSNSRHTWSEPSVEPSFTSRISKSGSVCAWMAATVFRRNGSEL